MNHQLPAHPTFHGPLRLDSVLNHLQAGRRPGVLILKDPAMRTVAVIDSYNLREDLRDIDRYLRREQSLMGHKVSTFLSHPVENQERRRALARALQDELSPLCTVTFRQDLSRS